MRALVYTQLFHLGPDRGKHNKPITHKNGQIFLLGLKSKICILKKSILHLHHAVLNIFCRHCTTSTWKRLIAHFMEDVNKRRRILLEAAWPSCRRGGLAIQRSRVRFPLWPLAWFVLGRPEFKSSATLVNSQLVQPPASCSFSVSCYVLFASFGAELFKGSACKLAG